MEEKVLPNIAAARCTRAVARNKRNQSLNRQKLVVTGVGKATPRLSGSQVD